MTDSMKFGPEWLRNLSADSLNSTNGSANFHTNIPNQPKDVTVTTLPTRNMFPEFRYGREEMLSLFEKNCSIPEILPHCKRLFVEKAQFPLAMTPCSDEDVPLQNLSPSTRTNSWLQRSPNSYSTSIRGLGRGSSSDRGRIRTKTIFHGNFIRTSNFDDDQRPNILRPDRNWSDRNGSGDISSSSASHEWNGTTTSRRDYINHRNQENWRKNKLDEKENSIETPVAEGWRNNGNGNISNSNKWGRSTSWRDDELIDHGSGSVLQRSNSSVTPIMDRNSTNYYSAKTYSTYGNNSKVACSNICSQVNKTNLICNEGDKSKNIPLKTIDVDDLPEWATEHPSNEGGTFDALGAFHGTMDVACKELCHTHEVCKQEAYADISKCPSVEDINNQKKYNVSITPNPAENKDATCTQHKSETYICSSNINFENKQEASEILEKNTSDISDQIKEVTDNMIKNLIMDDDGSDGTAPIVKTGSLSQTHETEQFIGLEYESNSSDIVSAKTVAIDDDIPKSLNSVSNETPFINESLLNHVKGSCKNVIVGPQQVGSNINNAKDLWYYRDPQSKVQGPFTALEMTEWFKAGYFNETLFVRRMCDGRFRALGELMKMCNGNIPFTNNHMLPLDLDNYQALNNSLKFFQFENYEDLKGDVTAAANSVNSAIKNIINTVDMTNMLNIHFQMLQEQYINHQENMILAELCKNEFFRQLSKPEQETIVRQRVRIPEYLSSISGLSNSLAALNPSAGSQLFNTLAPFTKKEELFPTFHEIPDCHHLSLHSGFNNNIGNNLINPPKMVRAEDIQYEHLFITRKNSDIPPKNFKDSQLQLNVCDVPRSLQKYSENLEKATDKAECSNIVDMFHNQQQIVNEEIPIRTLWTNHGQYSLKDQMVPNNFPLASDIHNSGSNETQSKDTIWDNKETEIPVLGGINIEDFTEIATNNSEGDTSRKITDDPSPQLKTTLKQSDRTESEMNVTVQKKKQGTTNKQEKVTNKKCIKVQQSKSKEENSKKEEDTNDDKKKNDKKRDQISQNDASNDQDDTKVLNEKISIANRRKLQNNSDLVAPTKLSKSPKEQMRIQSSVAPWSIQASEANKIGPCLAEIQKAERSEKRAAQLRQHEQTHNRTSNNSFTDVNEVHPKWNASSFPVKSITEIQAEEAKRLHSEQSNMQKKKENDTSNHSIIKNQSSNLTSNNVWSGNKPWNSTVSLWEGKQKQNLLPEVATSVSGSKNMYHSQKVQNITSTSNTANVTCNKSQTLPATQGITAIKDNCNKKNQVNCETKKNNKQKHNSTNIQQSNILAELEVEFTNWCLRSLSSKDSIVDVPTFVSFLKDLESPFEVKDYIRMYLGDSKETNEFGKQFLERRSKYKNLQRAQKAHNDDMCKPAPALTPCMGDTNESKGRNKKMKKTKMTKLDSRILGFSVTAAEGRINVGDRDYVDGQ